MISFLGYFFFDFSNVIRKYFFIFLIRVKLSKAHNHNKIVFVVQIATLC